MKQIPKCQRCSQRIFAHVWLGRTRTCIAPIPQDEKEALWAGELFLSLQKEKEERRRKRHQETSRHDRADDTALL